MSKMLASLDRLEELSVHSEQDKSAGSYSGSNSMSNSKSGSNNDSSGNDLSGTTGASEADIIAQKAGKQVFCLKFFVIFILVAATAMVGAAVYLTTKNGELESFQSAFEDNAVKVFDTFTFSVERKLGALDKYGIEVTSLAIDSGSTFPFFTMPDFAFRVSGARVLASAAAILYLPLVTSEERSEWETYSVQNGAWIQEGVEFQDAFIKRELEAPNVNNGVSSQIFTTQSGIPAVEGEAPLYTPLWQHSPVIPELVNFDLLHYSVFQDDVAAALESEEAVIGKAWHLNDTSDSYSSVLSPWLDEQIDPEAPISKIFFPVFDVLHDEKRQLVALTAALINWGSFFNNILPPQVSGIIVVLSNECDQVYTYKITGETAEYVGPGDQHEKEYDSMGRTQTFEQLFNNDDSAKLLAFVGLNVEYCPYTLSVYPSAELEDQYVTSDALNFTIGVVAIFASTIILFIGYDFVVTKRQQAVMKRAVQSRAIVSSLFPAAVRDRLFRGEDSANGSKPRDKNTKKDQVKSKMKNFLSDIMPKEQRPAPEVKPIADLFPHTTVMFADIAGFTRWSSERDPTHVFTLLQTVYAAFDKVAKKRSVFKVETIGDCYVAVTGLPDPQPDHAIRMAKFANECKEKFTSVVEMLKLSLGEDTAELAMRFGLHSGPVTAGVLRGEKSRFQLFGNTVNTAAKMENTGQKNKIQVSSETADLITAAGKGHWIFLRVDDIAERGGIQTYWVEPQSSAQEAKHNNAMATRVTAKTGEVDHSERLINWNTDLLKRLLKRVVAHRKDTGVKKEEVNFEISAPGTIVRDEIVPSISLPVYDKAQSVTKPESINLSQEVEEQLRKFVTLIASLYHDNPFHNFKHASNVCTNANKLMNSITDQDIYQRTNDPLTQFAVVFSALIHDADHEGVPNMTLMKEKPRLAALYKNKSCAEQNSVDLAWNLLLDPEFGKLQETIFHTNEEFRRFRQIVVNIVMSTDIFDRELNGNRDERWKKSFEEVKEEELHTEEIANLRATVAIECAMQLSDIMHTTQHFHSYCGWNERLFEEMYAAYQAGRSKKDPSDDWYQGEIWFFDNCVIPMAERVRNTKVFGALGEDTYRNAIDNKKEWAMRGGALVAGLIDKVQKKKVEAEEEVAAAAAVAQEKEDNPDDNNDAKAEEKKKASDSDKHLVEWNVDLFKRLLRQILAHRMGSGKQSKRALLDLTLVIKEGSTVRDELSRIISFPFFDKEASKLKVDPETIELDPAVEEQLREYILYIASMYKDHAFHNFKHASNVATTANKFLQRIKDDTLEMQVFDPLTQFAIIFSSLIHDVDHPGVPNSQLVAESHHLAETYKGKSIAEQNSVDSAWNVLMDSEYRALQMAIYANQAEMERFRKMIVNTVMATDLFDPELVEDRLFRWKQAFDEEARDPSLSVEEQENLRATVVVEHVLMASDIGHCVQHWHSFKRWNERLYFEWYEAFLNGRLEKDPTTTWYQEEIKFFDEIVIPMANRLKDCGVFGMAGEDSVRCALSNRKEWVVNGGAAVEELKKRYKEFKDGEIR